MMFDVLAVGELLGDFIGSEISTSLYDTNRFDRFQGGSPSNLAINMARLGCNTAIVSCLGNDNLGRYLLDKVKDTGINTSYVCINNTEPSSIVLVSRTTGTPDFIPYRGADKMIESVHLPDFLLQNTKIFHTTCWPLSMKPSQDSVLEAAKKVKQYGGKLSLDLNYAARVWPNIQEAQEVIKKYMSNGALIKLSDDDAARFFGPIDEKKIFETLQSWGAELIVYTLGSRGSKVVQKDSNVFLAAKKVEVADATGAGDAFWSGFLTAYLKGLPPEKCAIAGSNMAAIKLQHIGPLQRDVVFKDLLLD